MKYAHSSENTSIDNWQSLDELKYQQKSRPVHAGRVLVFI